MIGPDGTDGTARVTEIKEALAAAGMPREGDLTGAEIRGWTNAVGSTGFSVRDGGDLCAYHVVIDGKAAGVRYAEYTEYNDNLGVMRMHRPVNADCLAVRIRCVFAQLGYEVTDVRNTGRSYYWDHDLSYTVTVRRDAINPEHYCELCGAHYVRRSFQEHEWCPDCTKEHTS